MTVEFNIPKELWPKCPKCSTPVQPKLDNKDGEVVFKDGKPTFVFVCPGCGATGKSHMIESECMKDSRFDYESFRVKGEKA